MPAIAVVGAQWGDEGKGKVIDLWSQHANAVVRFGGGANAGHTLVVGNERRVFHLVPSGALHEGATCVIGQGTVIDPEVLIEEIEWLEHKGLLDADRLWVSDRAHVVLPHHKLLDGLRESGDTRIGTTKRGIGPAYEDKVGRRGIRIGDLLAPAFLSERIAANLESWRPVITALGGEMPDTKPTVERYLELGHRIRPHVCDTGRYCVDALERGDNLLLEGAQGTMLDIDHGTYPYVTSSTAVAGGACAGAGLGPTAIERVLGITKAYTTRVGDGPFPTELEGDVGKRLRDAGNEYGATTGRPRRCGWLDAVALRYAVRVNGMSELALTKLDVLSHFEELRICVQYELDGKRISEPPWNGLDRVKPIYETMPGWEREIVGCSSRQSLPPEARAYITRIEQLTECPIGLVSFGPDRSHALGSQQPF